MDQGTPLQFGTGSNLLGGSDAINQAIARRGTGAGVTQQVSPSAPTFDPTTQPAAPVAGQAPSAPQAPQAPQAAPQSMNALGQVTSPSDDTLIIKALSQKLKDNSNVQRAQASGTF